MSGIVGINSVPAMGGTVGVLQGIQAELGAATAANSAGAMAVLPAGNEGASTLAMAKHHATAADFATQFEAGIEQMIELSTTIQAASVAHVITDVGSAAAF
jgi:hypothetical protein